MTDKAVLADQYGDNNRLTARQSLWAHREGPGLPAVVLDRAELIGTETIVDVGCGNGTYLAELGRRQHRGPVVGLDLSPAMARRSAAHGSTAVADAQALPLADHSVDAVLSLHMLYHVPDIERAIAELRRVLRPGGPALVTTNGPGHTREVKRLFAAAARRVGGVQVDVDWDTRRFAPHEARQLLGAVFNSITVYEVSDTTPVRDPSVLVDYVASWPPESVGLRAGPLWEQVMTAVEDLVAAHFAAHESFSVSSRVAILRAR
jgi:SAM-dependent methyltransferase